MKSICVKDLVECIMNGDKWIMKMLYGIEIGGYGDDGLMLSAILGVLRTPARNDPRSGLLQRSDGRLFQSLAVRGKMSIYVRLF